MRHIPIKKLFSISMALLFTGALAACDATPPSASAGSELAASAASEPVLTSTPAVDASLPKESEPAGSNILVAYFSHSGNTEALANMVSESTGGDLFRIETVTPYPDDYDATVDIASDEQAENARPELATHVGNMDSYDAVFIGYPNWWGTMPMALFTFMEEYDFAGKTVIPFATHAGSGLGRGPDDLAKLVPEATLLEGLALSGNSVDSAEAEVEEWVASLGIKPTPTDTQSGIVVPAQGTGIILTYGETEMTATLYDSATTRDFLALLPLTLEAHVYGGREYAAPMEATISADGEAIDDYSNGDVTFYPPGNSLAVFYANEATSNQASLIRMGRITSDLSLFEGLPDNTPLTVEIAG